MAISNNTQEKKIILVTGASSGIGRESALALVEKGHTVYGTSRNTVNAVSDKIQMMVMDVTDRNSVKICVDAIVQKEGRIDVLVNSAGAGISGPLEEITDEEMLWQMDVNFFGVLRVTQAVLPTMRLQRSGLVININSLGGQIGLPYQGMYSASKFALHGITEAFEKELYPFDVRFVSVVPGDIATPFTERRVLNGKNRSDSPYKKQASETLKVIEKDETGGMNPEMVGRIIEKVVSSRRPRHRYVVAGWDQKLAGILKNFLPGAFFSWIIRDHYKVK